MSAKNYAMKQALRDFLANSAAPHATEREVLALYGRAHTVFAICNIRGRNVSVVDFEVYDPATDKRLTGHPLEPMFARTSNFYEALHYAEITLSLIGKTLLLPNPNTFGMFSEFSDNMLWVKPADYTLDEDANGSIEGFRLNNLFAREYAMRGYVAAEQALYLHLIDLLDDNDGISPAEAAFNAAGTQRELGATQFAYFMNRMLDAVFIQPAPDPARIQSITREAAQRIQKVINRFGRGSVNTGMTEVFEDRWEILNAQGDFAKLAMRELSDTARDAICEAYELPPELLTFQASNYAQSESAIKFWRQHWLTPRINWYASKLTAFFTKWYGTPVYIRADLSKVLPEDLVAKTERAVSLRNNTFVDLYTAAIEAGVKEPAESLRGLYVVDGVPVPADSLATYYQIKAKQSDAANAFAALPVMPAAATPVPAPADTSKDVVQGKPVYTLLSLADNADLIGLQRRVKLLVPDPAAQWNEPVSFHVTLVGAPAVTDEQRAALVDALKDIDFPALALKIGSLKTFDSLGEYAVHFRIRQNQALRDLQREVYDAYIEAGISVNSYSLPERYMPHITMGYCKVKPSAITFDNKLAVTPKSLIVSDEEHQPLLTITAEEVEINIELPEADDESEAPEGLADELEPEDDEAEGLAVKALYLPDAIYRELDVLTRKVAKGVTFTPERLAPAVVYHVEVLAAFYAEMGEPASRDVLMDAARKMHVRSLRTYDTRKSAQSTRLDFELALEDLFSDAVEGVVKRSQFKTRLMQAIRGYGERLYLDGMNAGGVSGVEIADLEDAERAEIEAHFVQQREYVNNVADAIYTDERVTPEEAANNKPVMWSNKSLMPLYYMGFNAAAKNAVMEWVLGNAEHCDSCKALSGQRRRMSFWKATVLPKSSALQCSGFKCACNVVVSDRPLSRGKLPRWRFSKKHEHAHGETCSIGD